jgi:O-antigen/teichoic acid export membrane protein
MTRLLVPDMFGVMAIANMVIMGLALFSDLGLRQNIIQSKRGSDPAFLNTAWIIQIFRGIVLWFIALIVSLFVFLADHIGMIPKNSAYADSRLPYVIAILSFGWLIGGFQSTKALEASRNLSLGHVTKIEITGQVAGLLVTFGWAVLVDRSIWALVAGNICVALVMTLISHTWLPGVANRWEWNNSAFREIIHFGKWMFLASIIGFLVNNGDRLLLGGVIDATTLGVYVIAFAIFTSVGSLLDKIISDVAFSALSEVIRERPADLKTSYYRFHIIIGSVAYFCSGILMFSGQSLIALLYDRRYEQAGWMLEILATALLITPFHLAINSLLALGLPRIFTQIIAVRGVVLFILVPLGFHLFGLSGALWALVASYSATLPVTLYYQIKCGFFDLWKTLLPVLAWVPGVLLAELLNFAVTRP